MKDQQRQLQNPPETQTPPSSPTYKKPKHNIWMISAIAMLILLTLAGIFALNQKRKESNITPQPTASSTVIPTAIPTSQENAPSDWKKYTNPEFNFSIKYPPSLIYLIDPGKEGLVMIFDTSLEKAQIPMGAEGKPILISASVIDEENSYPIPRTLYGQPAKIEADNKILVGGIEGEQVHFGEVDRIITRVIYNGKVYYFNLHDFSFRNEYEEMLTTFKFLDQDQTDETADWKTYVNKEIGFSLKYPPGWFERLVEQINPEVIKDWGWKSGGSIASSNQFRNAQGDNVSIEFILVPRKVNETIEELANKTIKINSGLAYPITSLEHDEKLEPIIDGRNSLVYVGNLSGLAVKHVEVYIPKNPTEVLIVYLWDQSLSIEDTSTLPRQKYRDILDHILSTFQFTD